MRTDLAKEREHAVELLSRGYSIEETAENMGITKKHVDDLLKEHDDMVEADEAKRSKIQKKITEIDGSYFEIVNDLYDACCERCRTRNGKYSLELALMATSYLLYRILSHADITDYDKIKEMHNLGMRVLTWLHNDKKGADGGAKDL